MISYLQIENLTKSYGDRLLFGDVTFGINQGDKIGLIAKNGTGKTTLLRIIAGLESPDSGTVTFRSDLRVGYLDQTPAFDPEMTVLDACMVPDTPSAIIVAEYEKALLEGDQSRIEKSMQKMEAAGAWNYDERLRQLLTRFK